MTRMCNSYLEAMEFVNRVSDRYECTIERVVDSWMVICER